jgi:hypothetical protein
MLKGVSHSRDEVVGRMAAHTAMPLLPAIASIGKEAMSVSTTLLPNASSLTDACTIKKLNYGIDAMRLFSRPNSIIGRALNLLSNALHI